MVGSALIRRLEQAGHTNILTRSHAELDLLSQAATQDFLRQEKPDFIKNGDAAIVKVKPVQPLVIEKQNEIPQLARFAVRDSGTTVAAGMCIDLVKK